MACPRSYVIQARIVETGAKKLSQLYTKLVAEASSGSSPLSLSSQTSTLPPTLLPNTLDGSSRTATASVPFSPTLTPSLNPVVASLRKMPLPSTHPSHPTAVGIVGALKDAQSGYAEMRGGWARKCLESGGRRARDRLDRSEDSTNGEGRPGVGRAEEIGKWIQEVIEVVDVSLSLIVLNRRY